MRILLTTATAIAMLATAGEAQVLDNCRHQSDRSTNVDAAGARMLEVRAGAGSLKIEGKAGLTRVVIRAKACASHDDLLDEIKLETRRDSERVVIQANVRDNKGWSRRNNQYARLDVVMEVPANIAADIDDGSGSIDLSNLGDVEIEDGSGEIVGDNLGAVRIRDGSGEITLRNIAGDIDIDDGSGEIDIRGARGSVKISDGSGSIAVSDVQGDFIVREAGSGGLAYDNVRGRIDVPRKRR